MNNDSTPSSAADLPTNPESSNSHPEEGAGSREQQQNAQTPGQKRAQAQTRKKKDFIDGLMNNLDMLIYVELCIVYYMDCSLMRLLIRVLAQMMFLTPKPNFVPPMPKHRPYIGAIFLPNIVCVLFHIFTARSEASEAMRGYLHGGVIIDLIGQKGPTSKLHLVLLDVLVTMLQCFMLAVHVERERLTALLALPVISSVLAGEGLPRAEVVSSQDHDAEERGIMRDSVTSNGDIELQSMAPRTAEHSGSVNEADTDIERQRLLEEPVPTNDREDDDPLDMFWSGTAVIADFHVLHTLRSQWDDYGNATASALQTAAFSAEFAAVTANRRINAASARFQQALNA